METEEEADSMEEMDSKDKEEVLMDKGKGGKSKLQPKRTVPPPIQPSDSDSDIEIPDQDEEEVVKGKSKGKGKYKLISKKTVRAIQTSDSDADMELPEPDVQTGAGAGGSWRMRPANFAVGASIVAVYDKQWYLA